MANPVTRKEQFLHAIAQGDASLLPTPVTREERFLRALSTGEEITPTTFEERFLQAALAFKGSGAGDGRSTFAIMSNYPTYGTKATQAQVDEFIDVTYATYNAFAVIGLSGNTLMVFVTKGTYITVDESASTISSDGNMYSLDFGGSISNRGSLVNWSSVGAVIGHEFYTRS